MISFLDHFSGGTASRYRTLPAVLAADDERMRDFGLIAGGLALLLSRCPRSVVARNFSAASRLHAELDKALRGARANPSRELVCDASHEVAEFTDRVTRDALLRRMRCPH
jgi:hypothetical protein